MKKLVLVLMMLSGSAFANDRECTEVLNSLTQLTYTYIDVLKSCRELENQGEVSSRFYEGYRRIARGTEETHGRARQLCYQVCSDTFFCESELSGACTK